MVGGSFRCRFVGRGGTCLVAVRSGDLIGVRDGKQFDDRNGEGPSRNLFDHPFSSVSQGINTNPHVQLPAGISSQIPSPPDERFRSRPRP